MFSDFDSNGTKLVTSPTSDKYFKINRPELFVHRKTEDLASEVPGWLMICFLLLNFGN